MSTTLYIDRRDTTIAWRDGALELRVPEEPLRVVPGRLLARVVLRAETHLSSTVLAALADAGIGLVAFGGRGGQRVAHVLSPPAADCRARIAQCLRVGDEPWATGAARAIVRSRLRAQLRLLARAERERPDLRKPLHDAQKTLAEVRTACIAATDRAAVRGFEGAGAAAFFRGYTTLFAPSLAFVARRRRPPPDPVNAALSLGYTLLHGQAVQASWAAGLDPMVGFLHLPTPGRPSLASDLVEMWRGEIEAWVWGQFRDRELRAEHFGHDGAGVCLLGKTGRARFYAAIHPVMKRCATGLRRQARALANTLNADPSAAGLHPLADGPDVEAT
jgi:CRISPR-associated protein Cas1